MIQHTNKSFNRVIIRHVILFAVVIGLLSGMVQILQNRSMAVVALIVLGIAHLVAAAGIVYLGRSFLLRLIRKVHGTTVETDARPETEGNTINWPSFYDLLVKFVLLGKEQQLRESVVELAQIKRGDAVLELGCGTGTFAVIAKRKAGADAGIIATDASPEMIAAARRRAQEEGVDVEFRVGLAEKIDFPDESFEIVMNSFMLHHLPDPIKTQSVAEIYRVLKPGGRVSVVDFEPPKKGLRWIVLRILLGDGMMNIDNTSVPPLLEEAGFTDVTLGNAGHALATVISGRKL